MKPRVAAARIPVLLSFALLGACTAKSYCLRPQPYDHVASIPVITGGEGLNIPNSPTALRVPPEPPPAQDVPFGSRVVDPKNPGKTVDYACLDEPPPLPPNADPTLGSGQ